MDQENIYKMNENVDFRFLVFQFNVAYWCFEDKTILEMS